jgi:hypothetical protein
LTLEKIRGEQEVIISAVSALRELTQFWWRDFAVPASGRFCPAALELSAIWTAASVLLN